jgi:hypothetical protein
MSWRDRAVLDWSWTFVLDPLANTGAPAGAVVDDR